MNAADPPIDELDSYLGQSVTLEQARNTPGFYIKDGDEFTLIQSHWTMPFLTASGLSDGAIEVSSNVLMGLFGAQQYERYTGVTNDVPIPSILLNAGFQIPKIPNDSQLVIIGIEDVNVYEPVDMGWTIPYGISVQKHNNEFAAYFIYHPYRAVTPTEAIKIESIDGQPPVDFEDSNFVFDGLFTGEHMQMYTFGWWEGTNWREVMHEADRRAFHLSGIPIEHEIVKTQNGYFEVNFTTPPTGYFVIESGRVSFAQGNDYAGRIVEFIAP
jgi:hypothetical protein